MTFKDKISKASNVRKVDPIYMLVAEGLSNIDILQHVKIYNGRIKASNILSTNGKKEPITTIGLENVVGVELLIDAPNKIIQFFSITSSEKGYGYELIIDRCTSSLLLLLIISYEHPEMPSFREAGIQKTFSVKGWRYRGSTSLLKSIH